MHLAIINLSARNKGNQEAVCQKNMQKTFYPCGDYEKDMCNLILRIHLKLVLGGWH